MLTGRSAEILGDIERHAFGVKLAELQERLRRPPQEIEAAVSQLKRQGLIEQRQPGIWTRTNISHGRVEREAQHARIVETGVVDRAPMNTSEGAVPVLKAPVDARTATGETDVGSACSPDLSTQERTMPRKTCEKCEQKKGPRAFEKGAAVCRECKGTNKAPAKAAPAKQQLRSIVERHVGRPGDAITAAIAELEAKKHDLEQLIEALKKVA